MLDATVLRWSRLPSVLQRSLAALAMVLFLALRLSRASRHAASDGASKFSVCAGFGTNGAGGFQASAE
jgi:hypothetical protein